MNPPNAAYQDGIPDNDPLDCYLSLTRASFRLANMKEPLDNERELLEQSLFVRQYKRMPDVKSNIFSINV